MTDLFMIIFKILNNLFVREKISKITNNFHPLFSNKSHIQKKNISLPVLQPLFITKHILFIMTIF